MKRSDDPYPPARRTAPADEAAWRRSFEQRFRERWTELAAGRLPSVVAALSGGCDSTLLLYLLGFTVRDSLGELAVAHFDHAMRPSSAEDAHWVEGLCRAWGVPLVSERATTAARSETGARKARRSFLLRVLRERGADWVATAHHADDQAETVLFRAARGTGVRGLAGIRPVTSDGFVRPLLFARRREIERYARAAGLSWRNDPTNLAPGPVRNRIRHVVLPLLESEIHPSAAARLAALAELAAETEEALEVLLGPVLGRLVRRRGEALLIDRAELLRYPHPVAVRVIRRAVQRLGQELSRRGTARAVQFIRDAPSGRTLVLPGGLELSAEFGQLRLERTTPPLAELSARIEGPGGGEARVRLGGRPLKLWWPADGSELSGVRLRYRADFDPDALRFPLEARGWRPGDRLRTPAGTKKLKKLFVERRVRRSERDLVPVLADGQGRVVWAGGLGTDPAVIAKEGQASFTVGFEAL
ncbi:MAG: tRNA lysidine(34) synthetase TilS [Longimicrobiaceae bacterium]